LHRIIRSFVSSFLRLSERGTSECPDARAAYARLGTNQRAAVRVGRYGAGRNVPSAEPRLARYIWNMSEILDMAAIASLVGDPARANILYALLDGRAFTAGELAYVAHVTPQTASGHLSKLAAARLITLSQQGRHRYYHLAGPHVAGMLESIMAVAAISPPRCRPVKIDERMRNARMCYDHVAGRLGVGLTDWLRAHDHVEFNDDGGALTAAGEEFLREFGVDIADARQSRRIFCRPCIDWSERRPHLAGAVGAALASRLFALGWISRVRDGRALLITPSGRRHLEQTFGFALPDQLSKGRAPTACRLEA
jgi:DNA-binding transcriptional ArsR family regulator